MTAYIKIKPGVDMTGLSPQIWAKAGEIAECFDRLGYECVITSARRPDSGRKSYHEEDDAPQTRALDFRAKHIRTDNHRAVILAEIVGICGPDYDVILHGDGANIHYHVEYDPGIAGAGR